MEKDKSQVEIIISHETFRKNLYPLSTLFIKKETWNQLYKSDFDQILPFFISSKIPLNNLKKIKNDKPLKEFLKNISSITIHNETFNEKKSIPLFSQKKILQYEEKNKEKTSEGFFKNINLLRSFGENTIKDPALQEVLLELPHCLKEIQEASKYIRTQNPTEIIEKFKTVIESSLGHGKETLETSTNSILEKVIKSLIILIGTSGVSFSIYKLEKKEFENITKIILCGIMTTFIIYLTYIKFEKINYFLHFLLTNLYQSKIHNYKLIKISNENLLFLLNYSILFYFIYNIYQFLYKNLLSEKNNLLDAFKKLKITKKNIAIYSTLSLIQLMFVAIQCHKKIGETINDYLSFEESIKESFGIYFNQETMPFTFIWDYIDYKFYKKYPFKRQNDIEKIIEAINNEIKNDEDNSKTIEERIKEVNIFLNKNIFKITIEHKINKTLLECSIDLQKEDDSNAKEIKALIKELIKNENSLLFQQSIENNETFEKIEKEEIYEEIFYDIKEN